MKENFGGVSAAPLGAGYSKIAAGAVPQPRLALPSRCLLVRDRRAGLGPAPTKGQDASASAVGAGVLTRPILGPLPLIRRGGYQPPESLPPPRGKVPSVCEADEGGGRNGRSPSRGPASVRPLRKDRMLLHMP